MIRYQTDIDLNYFNKLLLKGFTQFLSDKTNMLIPTGLELTELNCVVKDNQYFKNIFGDDNTPPAFYSYINRSIYINYQHSIFYDVKTNESKLLGYIMFALFHEANHSLLYHKQRMKQRNPLLWNLACDYEIHNVLYMFNNLYKSDEYSTMLINVMKNVACDQHIFLFDESYLSLTAEEIYDQLIKSKDYKFEQYDIYFNPIDGSFSYDKISENDCKCKVDHVKFKTPNGNVIDQSNIEFPDEYDIPQQFKRNEDQIKKDQQNNELKRTLLENSIRNNVEQFGDSIGDIHSSYNKLLNKLFHVKIDWQSILKNSLHNVLEKSDVFSWAKPRMISLTLPNINYLPDIEPDEQQLGTVIISRDESGSISDDCLQKISNIINDAKDYYKKVIVIKHDVKITSIKQFDNLNYDQLNSYLLTRESIGGTSHKDVFDYIKQLLKDSENQISCYIGITDLESDIKVNQDIIPPQLPIFWLCPQKSYNEYVGKEIRGQKILIES